MLNAPKTVNHSNTYPSDMAIRHTDYLLVTAHTEKDISERVNAALSQGYMLWGTPFSMMNGQGLMCVAQAVVKFTDQIIEPKKS